MDFRALEIVRERLRTDAGIQDFVDTYYPGLPLRTFIGLKPDLDAGTAVAPDDFPYLAISPLTGSKPARPVRQRGGRISITFGVIENDTGIEDGVSAGIRRICDLSELILAALSKQPLDPIVWDGAAEEVFDAGIQAPYYEGDLIISVSIKP